MNDLEFLKRQLAVAEDAVRRLKEMIAAREKPKTEEKPHDEQTATN